MPKGKKERRNESVDVSLARRMYICFERVAAYLPGILPDKHLTYRAVVELQLSSAMETAADTQFQP